MTWHLLHYCTKLQLYTEEASTHHDLGRLLVNIQERFVHGSLYSGLLMKAELSREKILCFTHTNMGEGGEGGKGKVKRLLTSISALGQLGRN